MAGVNAPAVSVVVPVFNAGRLLQRAVSSVVGQTYRDWELILVDDGSTDAATQRLLEQYAKQPRTTVLRTPNRGPSQARNHGIQHGTGALVVPLDADDWLAPRFLEKTARLLETTPSVAIAYTWVRLVGGHTGVWRTGPLELPALLSRCTVHVTALYRRQVWTRVGGYDPRFVESAEDWDFWLSAAQAGFRGGEVPESLVYYRRCPGSREQSARDPEVAARLMRLLVQKHRSVYQAHMDQALGGLFAEKVALATALERIYDFPGIRWGVKVREALRQARILR